MKTHPHTTLTHNMVHIHDFKNVYRLFSAEACNWSTTFLGRATQAISDSRPFSYGHMICIAPVHYYS